ncbi:flavonol sulfotransferase-like [Nicotiana tabacum]|uniref:Sulfotransferase n=2 Tax=Nicotiana TaxID=4085 RepID=A0A1S3YPJ4_TOBAC|nr:PREDICTED: flavonol sulfotransferase-like [Nicotiana sylvestris]XP_016454028.1 PREDICTED: flavonol sulfotransferase-like [Nicotiana tabacum]
MKSSSPSKASRLCANIAENSKEVISMKYKEIISTLPKRDTPYPPYEFCQYKGFWFPFNFLEGIAFLSEVFKADSSDIFLCSFPKTGTNWLKALAFSIMTRSDQRFYGSTKLPQEIVPTMETDYVFNPTILDAHELPLFATHLPYSLLPQSILDSDCKIVYICREPKDTFVSLWHFTKTLEKTVEELKDIRSNPLEQEFEDFCEGKSFCGPFWDHVTTYWKASVDRPNRVFFLTYEDLKSDTLGYVKKLAEFMGKPFSHYEEAQDVPEKIVTRCSFQNLKSLSNLEENKTRSAGLINNSSFFRKGEIGDWKNLLTEDMVKSIDQITQEKFQCLGFDFPHFGTV